MAGLERFPTELTPMDKVHDLAQDLGIPLFGALLRQTIEPPLRKRQTDWFDSLIEVLDKHEKHLRVLSETNSSRLDEVISVISQSYISSARSHIDQKRKNLFIAIEKTIIGDEDYNIIMVYIRLIDELQPFHMSLLAAYEAPERLYEKFRSVVAASPSGLMKIDDLFTVSAGNLSDFVQVAATDLASRGLIDPAKKHFLAVGNAALLGSLTKFGRSFMTFIKRS